MRKLMMFLTVASFVFSGAALAGDGDKDMGHGSKDKQDRSTAMAVEQIDRRNAVQAFNKADEDSDFKLNKSEARRIDGLEKRFSNLDSDGDGALDYSEFRSLTQTASDQ